MSGITNIQISNKEFKYYKQWVEETQNKNIQEYMAEQIQNKLKILKKQDGKCNQRSILLQKGDYKGSCIWNSKVQSYKIWLRNNHKSIHYGFFSNLYSAENELQRLFKNDEEQLLYVAKEQQQYYQLQHRLTTRPKLTDNTKNITRIDNCKQKMVFLFANSFTNPLTNKQQKQITWGKHWFKNFPKKQILDTCVKIDDPVEIIKYREDLKQRLKEAKEMNKKEVDE